LEAYIAAYSSDGKLLNYGNLSDSSNWKLKGECKDDKIDILYFSISHDGALSIAHIKDVSIGYSFTDTNRFAMNSFPQDFPITLKVEDFGNHSANNTSLTDFEMIPRNFNRGYPYTGEFNWDKIEDGYTYNNSFIVLDQLYQGKEILIFERGTNKPFVYYLNIPANELSSGDTITLNKSDFTPAELNTIEVSSSNNEFEKIYLYTYNSSAGKKTLLTSFDQVIPDSSGEKTVKYIISDILSISNWNLNYFGNSKGSTSYKILSNKIIPSSIEIKELTGQKISMTGDQINFTHSNIFPDKNLTRSIIQFTKNNSSSFTYYLYSAPSESIGETTIKLFDIPEEILMKFPDFKEFNNMPWNIYRYSHIYTNIPENSPIEYFENSILNLIDKNSSTEDYTYEEYYVNF
jgi:hypothetical protein